MINFNSSHKTIVILKSDFEKFQTWAVENAVEFQEVKTESDANEIHSWLPSEETEYQSSWEDSGC